MRLNLREIIEVPGASVPFECELGTENLDFPSVAAYKSLPHAVGRVYNEAGVLRLEGTLTAEMRCICDRCGSEFDSTKETKLDAVIAEEESEDNPELFILDGDEVDLDEILSTLFILDMETKFLCREDCKGLCPTCGKNLNLGPCGCRKEPDPRFAVLEQLLDKDPDGE
ncbi:MAG: YceD family protein [Candidatus Limivicinus sp.]